LGVVKGKVGVSIDLIVLRVVGVQLKIGVRAEHGEHVSVIAKIFIVVKVVWVQFKR